MRDSSSSSPNTTESANSQSSATTGLSESIRSSGVSRIAKLVGDIFAIMSIVFLSVIAIGITTDGLLSLILITPAIEAAMALSYVIFGFCVLTVIGTIAAWKYRYWSRRARIHRSIIAALTVAFTWSIYQIGFLQI